MRSRAGVQLAGRACGVRFQLGAHAITAGVARGSSRAYSGRVGLRRIAASSWVVLALGTAPGCGRTGLSLVDPTEDVAPGSGGTPTTGGGAGGGGPAPDAGTGGAQWIGTGQSLGCKLQRLATPTALRLFEWEPCADGLGCERARFSPKVLKDPPTQTTGPRLMAAGTEVHDDGEVTRVTLLVSTVFGPGSVGSHTVWMSDASGQALDGYRFEDSHSECKFMHTGLWGARFGLEIWNAGHAPVWLLSEFAGPDDPLLVDILGNHFPAAMGTDRWAYGGGIRMASKSNRTGDDEHVFAQFKHPQGEFADGQLHSLTSAGARFLFERQAFSPQIGPIELYISDGIEEGKPYLSPPPDSNYFNPGFANSHVIWLRGLNQNEVSQKYEKIEVWASPFAVDGSTLAPEKLGDTEHVHRPTSRAGWGRYVMAYHSSDPDSHGVEIWSAKTKTRIVRSTGEYGKVWDFMGITRTHLWLATDTNEDNGGDHMLRYELE